jgi:hypothetical protein
MAAPNLKSPATITGKAVGYAVTTSLAAALSNSAASNKLLKINSVYCSNVDGLAQADITLTHYNGTVDYRLAYTVSVPADATQILIARDAYIYLEEGQSLRAQASANSKLELVISYEEIN